MASLHPLLSPLFSPLVWKCRHTYRGSCLLHDSKYLYALVWFNIDSFVVHLGKGKSCHTRRGELPQGRRRLLGSNTLLLLGHSLVAPESTKALQGGWQWTIANQNRTQESSVVMLRSLLFLLDLFAFCIYYIGFLCEGWVGGWKRINLRRNSIKQDVSLRMMHWTVI